MLVRRMNMGRKRKWGKTAAIIAASIAGVAALGIWGVSTLSGRLRDRLDADIEMIEVTGGTIESTVTGTGTLEYQDAQDVTVPSGLSIESVLLGQGSQVAADDLLATVSLSTVELRMSETYQQIAEADQKMRDMPAESKVVEVRAPAAGRISAVHAVTGASVLDTLASSGALAVLDVDGASSAQTGEDTAKGMRVVGPAGTVESVRVSPGASVKAGDVLVTVRTSGRSAEYMQLEQERAALAREYDQLARIAASGGITAPISGTVTSCAVSEGQNTSALQAESDGTSGSGGLQLPFSPSDALSMFGAGMSAKTSRMSEDAALSAEEPDNTPADTPTYPPDNTELPAETEPVHTREPDPEATSAPRPIPRVEVPLVPPIPGLPLQTELAVLPVYVGTVEWDPADVQAQHETVYTARVTLCAADGYVFADDCTASVLGGTPEDIHADGGKLTFTVTYPETAPQLVFPDIDWDAVQDFLDAGGSLDLEGLRDLIISGILPSSGLGFDFSALSGQLDSADLAGLYGQLDPSVIAGALDGASLPDLDASSLYEQYGQQSADNLAGLLDIPSEPVAYTIAPDDGMQVTIRINQMDILSVQPGMRCTVTVDAIPDTEFEGTVKDVSQVVTNDGDYTATITVAQDDRMRSGMTASATIVTQETDSVLTLPVAALQEDGNRVYVYTGYDEDTREFTDEVDVETGVSNGHEVEVTSGLEPGQVVYYRDMSGLEDMVSMMAGGGRSTFEDEVQADDDYVPPDQAIVAP